MVLLIVLVPLATLLFFNVAMRIYVQKTDRSDLKEAMLSIKTLAEQELGTGEETMTESRLESAAIKLIGTVQSSGRTGMKLLIFNKNDTLVYPKTTPDGFVSASLAKKISVRLRATDFTDRVEQIKAGSKNFLITGYVLSGNKENKLTIVLVSQLGTSGALIRMINIILLVIMLIGIGVGVFVVSRLSERMSKHVGQICETAGRIGKGDFTLPKWEKTDIAEFNQLTQSISNMSCQLEASERSQRDFLQNASHELRTPLMSIQGYAEGISSGIVPDVKEAAEIINGESHRLNTLVDELLTLSRIESRSIDRKMTSLNLCNLLPEFVQRLGGIAVKQKKEFSLTLPSEPVVVNGDEELLGQAVANILSNCLRYAREKVEITLLSDGNAVTIRIKDDGPGIPEEDLPHLFERFYKGKGGKFGLGLAIARFAVLLLGGDIKAYNGNTGAVFDIILKS